MREPTAYEQYMLELVNRARRDPNLEVQRNSEVGSLNQGLPAGSISAEGKQPLAFNFNLIDAAGQHSQWMLDTDIFSHTGISGSSAGDRMRAAGYEFTGSWTWGENLSTRGTTGTPNLEVSVPQQHNGLFASPGHRRNLMNPDFREVGIGIQLGEFDGFNSSMITQKFARSGSNSFLTGVVFTDQQVDDDFYTIGEGLGAINVQAVRSGTAETFSTQTFGSGGYSLALTPGTYTVNFSGGALPQTVTQTVTIGDTNIKLDIATDDLPAVPTLPAGFDPVQYLASYDDLIQAFGFNPAAAQQHYVASGSLENRPIDMFNEIDYLAGYDDLIGVYGFDPSRATEHYVRFGHGEGRLRDNFDGVRYLASYGDLIEAFGFDPAQAAVHYISSGAGEGRNPLRFDPQAYLNNYGDLQAAFGNNFDLATEHYVRHGYWEGRTFA